MINNYYPYVGKLTQTESQQNLPYGIKKEKKNNKNHSCSKEMV